MNGAEMKNFATADAPFASARVGAGAAFVSEVDESDGSIALYSPTVAVVNNISLDHKSMEELRALFARLRRQGADARCSTSTTPRPRALARGRAGAADHHLQPQRRRRPTSSAGPPTPAPGRRRLPGHRARAATAPRSRLQVPGLHNVANALAAIAAARALGVDLARRGRGARRLHRHPPAASTWWATAAASP